MKTIFIGGRTLDDAPTTRQRLGEMGETALYRAVRGGMPAPIKIGGRRWFDREAVDEWVLLQHWPGGQPDTV